MGRSSDLNKWKLTLFCYGKQNYDYNEKINSDLTTDPDSKPILF